MTQVPAAAPRRLAPFVHPRTLASSVPVTWPLHHPYTVTPPLHRRCAAVTPPWQDIISIACVLSYVKLLRYLQLSPRLSQLTLTLSAAAPDLAGFMIIFLVVYTAYAQAFYSDAAATRTRAPQSREIGARSVRDLCEIGARSARDMCEIFARSCEVGARSG